LALTPEQNSAFLREVDDAVRQDDFLSFWTRYGRFVAVAVVVALAGFGGWLLWQNHQVGKAEKSGEQFAALLKGAQATRLDDVAYAKLTSEGGDAYRTEAELVKAALIAGRNDDKGAIAAYDKVAADSAAPQPMKELALIRRTAIAFDSMKPTDVIATLKSLAVAGNPWFGSAGELTAIAYLKMNKKREAGEMFASVSRDAQVQESIRLRAGQMASMLGVDTPGIGQVTDQEKAIANAQ
jgi:hypothetical protein